MEAADRGRWQRILSHAVGDRMNDDDNDAYQKAKKGILIDDAG